MSKESNGQRNIPLPLKIMLRNMDCPEKTQASQIGWLVEELQVRTQLALPRQVTTHLLTQEVV